MLRSYSALLGLFALLAACTTPPVTSSDFPTGTWHRYDGHDQPYLLWPGDTIDVTLATAPELSRTLIVAPDGQIRMPLVGAIAAAGKTVDEVKADLVAAFSVELNDPSLEIVAVEFGSQRAFIGGAVGQPGIIDLPGQIDPLQAIIIAGGFTDVSDTKQVLLIRRVPGGEVKSALFDIRAGLKDPALASWGPIQRFDVVYVSKTWIAQENLFVRQYLRNALPVDFSIFFGVTGSGLF